MMEPLPDPLEMWENSAEAWAFENIKEDKFKCANYGAWTPIEQSHCSGNSHYSLPICSECVKHLGW